MLVEDWIKGGICTFMLAVVIAIGIGGLYGLHTTTNTTLASLEKAQSDYAKTMKECAEDSYVFVVDGTEVERPTDEFIQDSFGKYNVAKDTVGKQIIMTTLQPEDTRTEYQPVFLPMFY